MKAKKTTNIPSAEIDLMIKRHSGWKGEKLAQLRSVIRQADTSVIEEVKWKRPSNPEGAPVWSHDGIICVGNILKNAVRLTFPAGAKIADPKKVFNTRMDSKTTRAVDYGEKDAIDKAALKAIIVNAVKLNAAKKAGK